MRNLRPALRDEDELAASRSAPPSDHPLRPVKTLVGFLGDPGKSLSAMVFAFGAMSVSLACRDSSTFAWPPSPSHLPAEIDLAALPAAELERMFIELERRPSRERGPHAAHVVSLALVHARQTGGCELCARVRPWVEAALSPPLPAAACKTGLAYAQLLAKHAGDQAAARAALQSLVAHAQHWPDGKHCVAQAERSLALLHGVADDDAGQPLGRSHAQLAAARAGAVAEPPATSRKLALEHIDVYGTGLSVAERQVRVVLGLDGPAVFHNGELAADGPLPRRAFLDLDGVALAPGAHALVPVGSAGLLRVRAFVLDASTTRVSFDIEPKASYHTFVLNDPYRVIVDFRAQAAASADWPEQRTIVLDPGHGGAQTGAHGPDGLEESSVALSIALRVRRFLSRALPNVRVVLTRDAERTVTLEERSAIANAVDAELFVSIHLNASTQSADKGGVSTYVLDTTDSGQSLRLAARENGAREQDMNELRRLFDGVDRKEQVGRSWDLAQAVQGSTLLWGRRRLLSLVDRGVQRAMFYVLAGTRMPAVLCEVSFITRPEEAAALQTDAYRDALAQGIAEGIVAYRKAHP